MGRTFWRPVTAIGLADYDNNPNTDIVTDWTPQRPTPPYPDYPSGHACFVGSVSGSLDNLFGPGPLERPYTMKSYVDGVPDRSYITTDVLDTETMNADRPSYGARVTSHRASRSGRSTSTP